ncbi:MAG: AAA family ATPase [Pseudoalteromonas sp.]|uniref:ATP-dependent DNA helicase n=1 Tax=Pseudoalteromonas sp. TaxID=53249 RepID=UPI001DA59C3F|nr:ATP-dependent RecD-like DNA helicase [Pseudoalteromonas sp.]NRA79314.1 AAA family ATPase [Pseudoalteromonas sp.]
MESAIGTVTDVIFKSDEKQIVSLKTQHDYIQVLLNNVDLHVEPQDHIRVRGTVANCSMWGKQIHANEIDYIPVTNDLLADFLMTGIGIGKATTERLITHFPSNLVSLLASNDINELSSVPRVSKAAATVICNNWNKQAGKVELLKFMDSVLKNTAQSKQVKLKNIAKKAYGIYGEQTVDKLLDDPYRVWAFSNFSHADLLASAMGIKADDHRRLVCAVEEVLYSQLEKGHTQVSPNYFARELSELLNSSKLMLQALTAAVAVGGENNTRIIISESNCPDDMPENERLYNRMYALPGTTIMENYVKEQLQKRLNSNVLPIGISDNVLDNYVQKGNKLSTEQKQAVKMILTNSVNVVSGGAGTGKTSVLYCANDLIRQSGYDVLQVALSGKASQRLIQQTDDDAFTIAALLTKIEHDEKFLDKYQVPVVHIDEASMVDLQSMYRILSVFENRPLRLVFIGDWAQLSPVGIGLIYHKLVKSTKVPKVELTVNFRSNQEIFYASEEIKNGVLPTANQRVEIIEYNSESELSEIVKRQYYLNTFNNNEAHIIAARLKTVSQANILLHKHLSKSRKVVKVSPQFRIGDKVIYKKNDNDLGLVNGSTGTIIGQSESTIQIHFTVEGVKELKYENIQSESEGDYILQHAYAMTCHSSQGSEFNVAIVIVEDIEMVERSWLYTAVTRAKERVIMIASKGAIENALARGFRFENICVGFSL